MFKKMKFKRWQKVKHFGMSHNMLIVEVSHWPERYHAVCLESDCPFDGWFDKDELEYLWED